jgi:diacylglycerol kinase (ATP)
LAPKYADSDLFSNQWPESLDNYDQIWIAGGDGTIHYFINKYPKTHASVGLLGGGTGNDLKSFIYGSPSLEKHVGKLLESSPSPVDVAQCNSHYYINSLGIGFDGIVLKKMDTIRWIGGHLGYLLAVIQVIFTFREFSFQLTVAGTSKCIKPVILAASNAQLTGGGFKIAPKAALTDEKLDLLYTDPLPWWKRLIILPKVEKGLHLPYPFVYHMHTGAVEISCKECVPYQLDGELYEDNHFNICISDWKLQLLQYH